MAEETVCRTVCQYSRNPVSDRDMKKLLEIAQDYRRVKNHVYARYGGIGSLSILYPGYTVQNKMTASGLRGELGLPSVYFYLAIFDALGDIKSQWTRTKSKILTLVNLNENLTEDEKHYLRFLLKVNNAFDAALTYRPVKLPEEIQKRYDLLAGYVDRERMHRYLRRQVRKYHGKQYADCSNGFSASERAYRYGDHGIYLSTKEKRKRVFIPLTDSNSYDCQIYIRLYPERSSLEIKVPIRVAVRKREGYTNRVGVSMGMYTMLTTDSGNRYGEELGRYQREYADWIRDQNGSYSRSRQNNPGRKKYMAKKNRLEAHLHSYIGQELNRFLKTEKPEIVYIVKLPRCGKLQGNKDINYAVSMWQRGYIRRHLLQKCQEQSVELTEVLGKNISRQCSRCGGVGVRSKGRFTCRICGYESEEKQNTAQNTLQRGLDGKILRKPDAFRMSDENGREIIQYCDHKEEYTDK